MDHRLVGEERPGIPPWAGRHLGVVASREHLRDERGTGRLESGEVLVERQ
jgi:hypothetical protein